MTGPASSTTFRYETRITLSPPTTLPIPWFLKQAPYPDLSILDAFKRYAPSNDPGNNPTTYANAVVNAINANSGGVTVDTLLRDLTDDQMLEMQNEIEQIEGTIEGDSVSVGDNSVPQVIKDLVGQVQPDP